MSKKKDKKSKAQLQTELQEEYNNLIERRDKLIERRDGLISLRTQDDYKNKYDTVLKIQQSLKDLINLTKNARLELSKGIREAVEHRNNATQEQEQNIINLRAEEPKLKLQLAGRIVNNMYLLLKEHQNLPAEVKQFVDEIEKIRDKDKQQIIFEDDNQLKVFKQQIPNWTQDKNLTKDQNKGLGAKFKVLKQTISNQTQDKNLTQDQVKDFNAILHLSEALNNLTQVDVNIYGNDITKVKDSLAFFTNYVQLQEAAHFEPIYSGGVPRFDEIKKIEDNRIEVLAREEVIQVKNTGIVQIQEEGEKADAPMKAQLDLLKQNAKNNDEEVDAHQEFQQAIIDKSTALDTEIGALDEQIDAHPANSKNKKTTAQKAKESLEKFASTTKNKASELGALVKEKLSKTKNKIADTEFVKGMSSLKDTVLIDERTHQSRNWSQMIKNQAKKAWNRVRGPGK